MITLYLIAVDIYNYRRCQESPFCSRNRHISDQQWKLDPKTIALSQNQFTATIEEGTYSQKYKLIISNLISGSLRFRIEPILEDSFRFDVSQEDVVINQTELETKEFGNINEILFQNQTHYKLTLRKEISSFFIPYSTPVEHELTTQELLIQYSPFMISLIENDLPLLIINQKGTAIFETHRDKRLNPKLFQTDTYIHDRPDTFPNGPSSVALDFSFLIPETDDDDDSFNNFFKNYHHNDYEEGSDDTTVYTSFRKKKVYLSGLASHTLPLKLEKTPGEPIRFSNTDVNHYDINSGMAMYGGVPILFARDSYISRKSFSLFWMNPSETWVDISDETNGQNVRFMSEGGYIDFIINSGRLSKLNDDYTRLTGRPYLTPLFALGYHQSKWGYDSQKTVSEITENFDSNIIPHDALWLDLDHTNNRNYFTWNRRFPQPKQLLEELEKNRRYLITIVDPHIRNSNDYYVYNEAERNGYLIESPRGGHYSGYCWPGNSVWPNFLSKKTRDWWSSLFSYSKYKGSGVNLFSWNDMNEMAVFSIRDATTPKTVLLKTDKDEGNKKNTNSNKKFEEREIHNIHGALMVSGTFKGLIDRNDNKNIRPFILTRSFFAGTQKYACVWTGDNQAKWSYLENSIPLILSHGLCGIVYIGADIGGFFDNPSEELLSRWHSVGAWCYSFYRSHCHEESPRREIYLYKNSKYYQATISEIYDRYRLLPYWYTLARQSNLTGTPIIRPLWYDYFENSDAILDMHSFITVKGRKGRIERNNQENEENIKRLEEEIREFEETTVLLGDALMICPFLEEGEKDRKVPFLGRKWYELHTGEVLRETIKYNEGKTGVFLREGRIIPVRRRIRKSAEWMLNDPITLIIAVETLTKNKGNIKDNQNKTITEDIIENVFNEEKYKYFAEGWVYIDDGKTFNYQKGEKADIHLIFSNNCLRNEITREGSSDNIQRISKYMEVEKIRIYGMKNVPKHIFYNEEELVFYERKEEIIIKKPPSLSKKFEIVFLF